MEKKIEVCYDGGCAFCKSSMQWLRKRDHHQRLKYKILPEGASHVILKDEQGTWNASTAALRALGHLGGKWKVISTIMLVIPRPIRDAIYRVIARNRNLFSTHAQVTQNNVE